MPYTSEKARFPVKELTLETVAGCSPKYNLGVFLDVLALMIGRRLGAEVLSSADSTLPRLASRF
jgi:hypothetical protein